MIHIWKCCGQKRTIVHPTARASTTYKPTVIKRLILPLRRGGRMAHAVDACAIYIPGTACADLAPCAHPMWGMPPGRRDGPASAGLSQTIAELSQWSRQQLRRALIKPTTRLITTNVRIIPALKAVRQLLAPLQVRNINVRFLVYPCFYILRESLNTIHRHHLSCTNEGGRSLRFTS